jgi:hypothetical protein
MIRFVATETTCEKVKPGEAFSEYGPDYWDNPNPGSIGECVYLRTDAPCPELDVGRPTYVITVEEVPDAQP